MTRSPTLLLRSLFGEPPTHELPWRLFRRAYLHAQYESGNLSDSWSVAIPSKQRAANWADFAVMIRNQSFSGCGAAQPPIPTFVDGQDLGTFDINGFVDLSAAKLTIETQRAVSQLATSRLRLRAMSNVGTLSGDYDDELRTHDNHGD